MALGLQSYFRETASGLRRNGIVAFAAMSTAFIALFLFGLALLIAREFNLVIDALTGNVQVGVYLTDSANADTVKLLTAKLEALPAVGEVTYESKEAACARFHQLFANQPVFVEGIDCVKNNPLPASLRVNLVDTSQFEQIAVAMGCSTDAAGKQSCGPGVETVQDYRDLLSRLVAITRVLSIGILSIAAIMLASAVALIANTLRMGMFARRKEIGIMRLVGVGLRGVLQASRRRSLTLSTAAWIASRRSGRADDPMVVSGSLAMRASRRRRRVARGRRSPRRRRCRSPEFWPDRS